MSTNGYNPVPITGTDESQEDAVIPSPMELMIIEEVDEDEETKTIRTRIRDINTSITENILTPMKVHVLDPMNEIQQMVSMKFDSYLSKVGNVPIIRRFLYIFFICIVVWILHLYKTQDGGFSDHDLLLNYVKESIDLNSFETKWEYISSMPCLSGTKGDVIISKYIKKSLEAMNMDEVEMLEYKGYMNFPEEEKNVLHVFNNQDPVLDIELSKENFNPLAWNGEIEKTTLIFGNRGSRDDFKRLLEHGIIRSGRHNYVLIVFYSDLIHEQILLSELVTIKGIIFISDKYKDDVIQMKSVGLPQYSMGNVLKADWHGYKALKSAHDEPRSTPRIPTIPLSYNQGHKLLKLISKDGVNFGDGLFSGLGKGISVSFNVNSTVKEKQPTYNVLGKIRGREQTTKSIIITASKNSVNFGALYPSFGTTTLIALAELFQKVRYKFNWAPLRNIYFMTVGGSEFNSIGAATYLEENLLPIKDEIYSIIDISELGFISSKETFQIETHPLLHDFLQGVVSKSYNASTSHVQHYGDWTPFMANGIPVSILSVPDIRNKVLPIDTDADSFNEASDILKDLGKQNDLSNLLVTLFEIILKLVDEPNIPFNVVQYVKIMDKLLQDIEQDHSKELNFNEIIKAMLKWKSIGSEWNQFIHNWNSSVSKNESAYGKESLRVSKERWNWNNKLSNIGRRTVSEYGLLDRKYYKNGIFGPTLWKMDYGVDSWSFPGVRDAIMTTDWSKAQWELDEVAAALNFASDMFK
ncbi:hypothetical protein NCAS_0B01170 [Naumovozyma castellii]|uniref:Transferrin receptor-like dimerisation domain-containing protein n=1 Tax=Naumovozyma castellii TaxID=27288 RepID=G0VB77_NAUCA|nr:hypothetical protein NCAS_0B01170 [Naumovozyma castellii CBS 4309]CCC68201.1 hypothetical protein NCAS_0B01170 [Naumovozyma castellii CBS 4309]